MAFEQLDPRSMDHVTPLDHESAASLLRAFHDRELDSARARALEAHLVSCPVCRSDLAEIQAVSRVLSGAAPAPGTCRPPVDIASILISGRRNRSREERLVKALQRIAAAAAVIIGASTVWIGWSLKGAADADGDDLLRQVAVSSPGAEGMIDDENSIIMALYGR